MYFPLEYTFRQAGDTVLINDVAKAINGEYSAIACYEQLAKLAPGQEERYRILEIRNDEIRHYRTFTQIYMQLTGRQPIPQITEPCPNEYRAGLRAAFRDEQETVDRYLDIAEHAASPHMKESFKRAAADEQNHGVWFLYFLTAG
ncbi:ferritin-like domain-containing protein [Paenibacillus thermotolerans]|uniref:ferritin-like domain-containing protein n=1 Tax=Paenibacillus thermotolerans TaxID=3027807 RepID=UPI0023677C2D|nr:MULTISPECIES: ferritin-like domain-containing protein [unclassified Paenibacillus]